MELGAEGRRPLDLLGSASRSSSLRNKRPSTQTKSVDPRAQPLLPHTDKQQEKDVSAHVAMFLVDVSLLNTKQMRSRMLTSFCQLHKKTIKTHIATKSLYIKTWFVCSNEFECLKHVETFQTPKRVP